MADGDLYQVGLEPGSAGAYSVPNASHPNGSIGGSDVGANEQDDQRVRDLMQQFLNSQSILEMLNNLLIINNPNITPVAGTDMLGENFATDWEIITQLDDAGMPSPHDVPDQNVEFNNGAPIIVEHSEQLLVSWQDDNLSYGQFSAQVAVQLFIDSLFMFEMVWEHSYFCDGTAVALNFEFQVPFAFHYEITGSGLLGGLGSVTAARELAALAAGTHTFHLRWVWSIPNHATDTVDIEAAQVHTFFHKAFLPPD